MLVDNLLDQGTVQSSLAACRHGARHLLHDAADAAITVVGEGTGASSATAQQGVAALGDKYAAATAHRNTARGGQLANEACHPIVARIAWHFDRIQVGYGGDRGR